MASVQELSSVRLAVSGSHLDSREPDKDTQVTSLMSAGRGIVQGD